MVADEQFKRYSRLQNTNDTSALSLIKQLIHGLIPKFQV